MAKSISLITKMATKTTDQVCFLMTLLWTPPDLSNHVQSTLSKIDTFGTSTKCPSYRESNKRSKERQGPTLTVRFTEMSI